MGNHVITWVLLGVCVLLGALVLGFAAYVLIGEIIDHQRMHWRRLRRRGGIPLYKGRL